MSRELKEKSIRWLLTGVAFVSLLSLACIMLFLFMEGLPLFADYPLWDFLTGHLWYPTSEPPEFGIFPLIVGSLAVTALASCIAVPLGIMTAAYLAEIADSRTRRIVKPFIELLAALPSVVIGFFGMVIVAPFLQDWFGADTGLNLLNASLMLAFMSVPTICSVAEDALFAVPRTLREASLALGATRWETLIRVVIPSALSGIGTAVMLGMSRAIGETMVVLMVAGGVWPCIVGTFLLAFGAMLIAFPLGVASAVYLHEYGGKGRYTRYLRLGISNLAGVPSVVFGLFGLAFFVTFLGMGVSLLAGVLTLAVLTLPVIINTTEEALRQVPDAWREASLALGATQSQTIARVVLPAAVPGMLTGAILGLARAAGETAAIMFTAAVFYTPKMPDSVFSAVMSLPYHMYVLATAGTEIEKTRPLQYGTALILLVLVLGMNLIAIIIRDRMQRKR